MNKLIRSMQKQIDDLQEIIGNGQLDDTLIQKINSLQSEIKEFKQSNTSHVEEQLQSVQQQFSQINKQLGNITQQTGNKQLQTNSQDMVGAINELLSLIKQNINMNTIIIALNDICQVFNLSSLKEQIKYFIQQIQAQVLNYNNVLTILSSSQDIIKTDDKKLIRYGYQDNKLFVEKYSKQSDVQDIRFIWDIEKGFFVNYDYCPVVIKCYTKNIFQVLDQDIIEDMNEILPSQFNGFIFGSLNSDRNIVQYNSESINGSNLQIYGCEINGHLDLEKCQLEEVQITTKYNKINPTTFNQCDLINCHINVPVFKEIQNYEKVQLKFQCCQNMLDNVIESAYLIEINADQYTQAQIRNMINENNTYLIDRNLLDLKYQTKGQVLCWEIDSMSKITFDKCDFIIRDEYSTKGSEIYINNGNIKMLNCKIVISTDKYSQYIKQPIDKLSRNSRITIESDITFNDAVINQSTLSAEKVVFEIRDSTKADNNTEIKSSGYKQYLIKSKLYSKENCQANIQGQVQENRFEKIDIIEVLC